MTQEDKQILLKVICELLPYKLHCCVFKLNGDIKENDDILYGAIGDNAMTLKSDKDECLMYYQIKPYLRPMSSMTEEEAREYANCGNVIAFSPQKDYLIPNPNSTDWLLEHHFDYRGLIEKGLAIEAPEGMYK